MNRKIDFVPVDYGGRTSLLKIEAQDGVAKKAVEGERKRCVYGTHAVRCAARKTPRRHLSAQKCCRVRLPASCRDSSRALEGLGDARSGASSHEPNWINSRRAARIKESSSRLAWPRRGRYSRARRTRHQTAAKLFVASCWMVWKIRRNLGALACEPPMRLVSTP